MPFPFLVQLLIGIAVQVVGFLISPKTKQPKPAAMEDMEEPTAESGRPMPVPFGSITIKSLNNQGYWDTETITRQVPAGEGGKK